MHNIQYVLCVYRSGECGRSSCRRVFWAGPSRGTTISTVRTRPPCTALSTRRDVARRNRRGRPTRRFGQLLVETWWPEWWRATGMQPAHPLTGIARYVSWSRGCQVPACKGPPFFCDLARGAAAHTPHRSAPPRPLLFRWSNARFLQHPIVTRCFVR